MIKKLDPLPKSESEFWEDAEKYISQSKPIPVCEGHGKDKWKDFVGYLDNRDGTASCKYCGWGFRIPGYLRIHSERVFDLREI